MRKLFSTTYTPTSLDVGLFIFRVFVSIAMIVNHAMPKWERYSAGGEIKFGDPIGLGPENSLILAMGAEFLCSILLILGFLTRLAVIPLIITMAVAAFIAHGADPFNVKESSLLFLFAYILLLITGPGNVSLDKVLFNKQRR